MLPVRGSVASAVSRRYDIDLHRLAGAELRRAPDGWHAVVPLGDAIHRLCLPARGSLLAVERPRDAYFDVPMQGAHRLWSGLEERPLGPPLPTLSLQRRQRLSLAMRALDGWTEGNTYRAIAEGLFGKDRVPDRAWKTHDLRNRTIRLVQSGFALMRGGYRNLLRQARRKK